MHRQNRYQYAVIGVISLSLLFMSIGFVAYSQISGSRNNASAAAHAYRKAGFDASSFQESDTSAPAIDKEISLDTLNFTIELQQPGDSYAAMINIGNYGNVDELLTKISMTELDENLSQYVDYRLTLNGEDYIGTSYDVNYDFKGNTTAREQLFLVAKYKDNAPNVGPLKLNLSAGLTFEAE